MTRNFKNIDYLQHGNDRQKQAYSTLKELGVFEKLKPYHPVLAGTIPLGIDVPESDLDLLCQCENHRSFLALLTRLYGSQLEFQTAITRVNGIKSVMARFKSWPFTMEIFAQHIAVEKQDAYRHMVVEQLLLEEKGADFKNEIIKLKAEGIKTEPAFAKVLNLSGNPYEAMLKLEKQMLP